MPGSPSTRRRALLLAACGLAPLLFRGPAPADPGTEVAIDVRPGVDGNPVDPDSRGLLAVAILGSADFDPFSVDVASVRFGPGAAAPADRRGRRRDVDRDGFRDLVLSFRVREAGLRASDASVRLAGRTRSGDPFSGADAVAPAPRAGGVSDPSLVLEFSGTDVDEAGGNGLDAAATTASFDGTVRGAVAARVLAASGDGSLGDFDPPADTTLSTDSPEAVDGAFRFRSLRIREGVTVRMTGTLPARLLTLRSAVVEGTLDASGAPGGDGEVEAGTHDLPVAAGGTGGPGGGAGGSSWGGSSTTEPGGAGLDGRNGGGTGGAGGRQADPPNGTWNFGGGGGGGGMAGAGEPGQEGNFPSFPEANAPGGPGGGAGGIVSSSEATLDGTRFHLIGIGGSGGGAGGNSSFGPDGSGIRNGAAAGGGGGGGLLLESAGDVTVRGRILARGGAGGSVHGDAYAGAAGGGGSGGTLALYAGGRADVAGSTLDASGGAGGIFTSGWQGGGGSGASGRIRIESGDGRVAGGAGAVVLPEYSTGVFRPAAGPADPPSVFVSAWFALGPRAPRVLPWSASDFRESAPAGTGIRYEVQMAGESAARPGRADAEALDPATGATTDAGRASDWQVVRDTALGLRDPTAALNGKGYRFLRVRITFTLDLGRTSADPLPSVDRFRTPLAE